MQAKESHKQLAPERIWINWPRHPADDAWYWTFREHANAVEYIRADLARVSGDVIDRGAAVIAIDALAVPVGSDELKAAHNEGVRKAQAVIESLPVVGTREAARLWHPSSEEPPAREELIAVHGSTFSVGYKHQFDAVNLAVDAWCTRRELITSSRIPAVAGPTEEADSNHCSFCGKPTEIPMPLKTTLGYVCIECIKVLNNIVGSTPATPDERTNL